MKANKFPIFSPINMEWSASPVQKNLSPGTYSEFEVHKWKNTESLGYSWYIPRLDAEEGGELEIDNNTLTGFDGLFELPVPLIRWCVLNGYKLDEYFQRELDENKDSHILYGWEFVQHCPHQTIDNPEAQWWVLKDNTFVPARERDLEKRPIL